MSPKALSFFVLLFLHLYCFPQDYFSYGGGNFSGLNQVFSNPAAIADNRLKIDIILLGNDFVFNNSWVKVKRTALKNSGSLTEPIFPDSWKNLTPSVPDNVYKNFVVINGSKSREVYLENRIILPSFMVQINSNNAIAFTWSIRQMLNADGISKEFANLFEKELDLSVTQNNRVQNTNLRAIQMLWAEYGLSYARVLKDKNKHFLKAGITPKLLQGLESAYLIVNELDFLLSTKDTNSYFNTRFSFAHSDNVDSPLPIKESYRFVAKPALGLDLGFVYEWRPHYKLYKYKPDGKTLKWRKDLNKYKVKFGAAIVDIGRMKFQKAGSYYDLDVSIRKDNYIKYISTRDIQQFDSLVKADFTTTDQKKEYTLYLPTALNTQLDYRFNKFFYVNLSSHFSNFNKSNLYRFNNFSAVCLAPRFESYWTDVSIPVTYHSLYAKQNRRFLLGINVRLGALSVGTNDIQPFLKGDISAINFYAILRTTFPYKVIHDQDGDGVEDDEDECPLDAGELTLKGCPDKDHDMVADKTDACPNQPGLPAFKGCPDTDNDGITDGLDACPFDKGSVAQKGCPDTDGDGVIDKNDACPDVAGLKQFKGCPDTDEDGIIDKEDECPTLKGIAKYKGCMNTDGDYFHDGIDPCPTEAGPIENLGCPWPDTDKDGIIDKLDSCVNTPGIALYKGCPAPVVLAPAEKKILQKAFSSLEFESGKDVIKPVSFPSLNALAKILVKHQEDWQLKLSGHTDNEGTAEANLILSEKRANAVKLYLQKKGVPETNIFTEWFGQTQPVADNSTKEGKRKNRRVEMTLLMKME